DPVALNASTKYWFCVRRTDEDTTNRLNLYRRTSDVYPGQGYSFYNGSTATWGTVQSTDLSFVLYFDNAQLPLYLVTQDTHLHVWMSEDGEEWEEQDAANAPAVYNS